MTKRYVVRCPICKEYLRFFDNYGVITESIENKKCNDKYTFFCNKVDTLTVVFDNKFVATVEEESSYFINDIRNEISNLKTFLEKALEKTDEVIDKINHLF